MNKVLFLTTLLLSTFLTMAQTSTITGNVIVNFNYTRNDPDVGAVIKLYDLSKKYSLSILDKDSVKQTSTDLLGNYTFKNVAAGKYLLYINSKGAMTDPFYLYNDLAGGTLSEKLKDISGFDFHAHRPDLQAEIKLLFDQSIKLSEDKKYKQYEKVTKDMNKKIQEYFDTLPSSIKLFFDIFGGQLAKEFKEIEIKSGIDENYVTKFEVHFN
jgi:hypothetical protein